MSLKPQGKFIVLEGLTCSGKDLQAELLVRALNLAGIRSAMEVEPTEGPFGTAVRAFIEKRQNIPVFPAISAAEVIFAGRPRGIGKKIVSILEAIQRGEKISALDVQLLFMADRRWHSIIGLDEKLASGNAVVCSRYERSTFAYGTAYGLALEELLIWQDRILGRRYLKPDITVFIRVSPRTAAERLAKSGKIKDINETEAKTAEVYKTFDEVNDFGRRASRFGKLVEVDGEGPIEKVYKQITAELRLAFGGKFNVLG